jgi:arginine decarboxylase
VLIANVSEVEPAPHGARSALAADAPAALRHLHALHAELAARPATEIYLEAQQHHAEGLALFALGQLDLAQRAALDDVFHALAHAVRARLDPHERAQRALLDELDEKLVDKYFVNFSVFESIPDVWAIDQIFPIVPIAGLDRKPARRGVIADLTCDSDGRIDHYVDAGGVDVSLPLHALPDDSGSPYCLGIFMVGAYQETLGDIHNLFGDTDAVNVRVGADGRPELSHHRRGDSAALMLEYVGYDLAALRETWRQRLHDAGLDAAQAAPLLAALQAGVDGYTYLATPA